MHTPCLKILLGNCYDHVCTGHTVTLFLHAVAITYSCLIIQSIVIHTYIYCMYYTNECLNVIIASNGIITLIIVITIMTKNYTH